jgi:hypothetical protein
VRLRLSAFVAVLATAAALAVPAATSAATTAPAASAVAIPITGAVANGGAFSGTFNLQRFAVQNGQLVAVGTLSGTLTDALGNVIGTVTNLATTLQVTGNGTCQILHLELGPLDLNLLGLMVHLDRVVLDITAQSGPGNLLGNLLCAIAHLLDNNAALTAVVVNLNRILSQL